MVRYYLLDDTLHTLHDNPRGKSSHLAVDHDNQTIYWILFSDETDYSVKKTTYDGQTTDQFSGTGATSDVDITQGNGYFYILYSTTSVIKKYDKSTGTLVDTLPAPKVTERIHLITGKCIKDQVSVYTLIACPCLHDIPFLNVPLTSRTSIVL